MACGSTHPELEGVHCVAPDDYPNHPEHQGFHDRAPVVWPNLEHRPSASTRAGAIVDAIRDSERTPPGRVDPREVGGAPVGSTHPSASARAADSVRRGSHQASLLALMVEVGDVGSTCAAAQPLLSMLAGRTISRNHTSTRMHELESKGLVYRVVIGEDAEGRVIYESRPTDPGGSNVGAVWRATEAGVSEARRLGLTLD